MIMRTRKLLGLIGLAMLLIMGVFACETTDVDRTFEGPYFVRFTDTTVSYKESYSKPIAIQVHNAGPKLDQPITINYTVSGTAREGKEYTIVGTKGTVIIPAKASTGNILVQLINNANNILESTSLTFTLTSVQPSTLQVGFGKENVIGKSLKLTIQDDCLLGGSYTGSGRVSTNTYSVPNIDISSADCKRYTISNWNIGIFNINAIKPTLAFIDNGDNSLTVPVQNNSELGSTDTISGSGAWNPRTRVITLNLQFKIKQSDGTDRTATYIQTYTPQ
jgi:hypothetical protein